MPGLCRRTRWTHRTTKHRSPPPLQLRCLLHQGAHDRCQFLVPTYTQQPARTKSGHARQGGVRTTSKPPGPMSQHLPTPPPDRRPTPPTVYPLKLPSKPLRLSLGRCQSTALGELYNCIPPHNLNGSHATLVHVSMADHRPFCQATGACA